MDTRTPDPTRHRALADLDAALCACTPPPPDAGRLTLLVRRCADGTRETPSDVSRPSRDGLDLEGGARRLRPKSELARRSPPIAGAPFHPSWSIDAVASRQRLGSLAA